MRRWQNLSAPDDMGAWFDVGGMWPTKRGTYETADVSTAGLGMAAGAGPVRYAFVGNTLTGTREFVIDTKIWEYSAGSLTDRTNGVSVGALGKPMMAMYGSVVILVNGVGTATCKSTSTTFSALAGAPQAEIVLACSNAVIYLNTDTAVDGWAATDVGDYTNNTTGEAASGRLIDTPGPILAGCVWNGDVYAFKRDAIYKGTYVGGLLKWLWKCVWKGQGVNASATFFAKYQVVACAAGIAFNAATSSTGMEVYLFDGASRPRHLNPMTTLTQGNYTSGFVYDPEADVLCVAPAGGCNANGTMRSGETVAYYYFEFSSGMWGKGYGVDGEDYETGTTFPAQMNYGVVHGDYYARGYTSSKPVYYRYQNITTNIAVRCAPSAPGSSSVCYVETTKFGGPEAKTKFDQLVPRLRRRTDLGTDSVTMDLKLFRELEDTSAQTTRSSIAESSYRKRFDLLGGAAVDNFARAKITYTAIDVEIDDVQLLGPKAAGKN